MKKVVFLAVVLACLMGFVAADCRAEEPQNMLIHFVVLPKALDSGYADTAHAAFQAEMIKLAGGFTRLGDAQGGSIHSGVVVPKDNVAYLVAANEDVSQQIRTAAKRLFGLDRAFILVWQGHLVR